MRRGRAPRLVGAIAAGWGLLGAGRAAGLEPALHRHEFTSAHMGTRVRIVVYADRPGAAETAAHVAFARVAELDERLSDYRDSSEVSALARAAGGPASTVSRDLLAVLTAAQDLARRSEGAFDVTCGPLSRLWRRARRQDAPPPVPEVEAARGLVGFAGLRVDPEAAVARLDRPGMRLDLGAIAKGYAADEALRTVAALGLSRALVELGGEVVAGLPPPGQPGWVVALPQDVPPLLLAEAAVSTSGDAEQAFESAGVRYSHVFDPRTGMGLLGRRSVTVVARRGLQADSLATAASVLGADRGRALVEATPGAALRFVEEGPHGPVVTESKAFESLARVHTPSPPVLASVH